MFQFKLYLIHMMNLSITLYTWIAVAYAISTWFVRNRYARWFVFLACMVEPVFLFLRRITKGKLVFGGFDVSPVLLFIGLEFLRRSLLFLLL